MRRYSQEERREIIKAFRSSGLTQREFARARGVNFHTLQHWLHYKPKQATPRFVEVKTTPATAASIRLHVSTDLELSLTELPPPAYLADLARNLRAPC